MQFKWPRQVVIPSADLSLRAGPPVALSAALPGREQPLQIQNQRGQGLAPAISAPRKRDSPRDGKAPCC